jgi:hypothetical protein
MNSLYTLALMLAPAVAGRAILHSLASVSQGTGKQDQVWQEHQALCAKTKMKPQLWAEEQATSARINNRQGWHQGQQCQPEP